MTDSQAVHGPIEYGKRTFAANLFDPHPGDCGRHQPEPALFFGGWPPQPVGLSARGIFASKGGKIALRSSVANRGDGIYS
jgi:hypothetical protein